MWEFMTNYATGFWHTSKAAAEASFEVFSTLMAWFLTIGCCGFFCNILIGLGVLIRDKMTRKPEKKDGL